MMVEQETGQDLQVFTQEFWGGGRGGVSAENLCKKKTENSQK